MSSSGAIRKLSAFRHGYTADAHGPCGSAPVSGVPEFSPGAGSSAAAVLLWLFAAEIGEIGFRLGQWHHAPFQKLVVFDIFIGCGTLHTINVNRGDCVACVISKCA